MRNKHENHFNLYNIAINLTKNIKKWKQIQCIENIENTKKTKKCKISIFNIFSIFWWFLLNFLQYLIIFMFISQLGANISPLGIYFGVRVLYLEGQCWDERFAVSDLLTGFIILVHHLKAIRSENTEKWNICKKQIMLQVLKIKLEGRLLI